MHAAASENFFWISMPYRASRWRASAIRMPASSSSGAAIRFVRALRRLAAVGAGAERLARRWRGQRLPPVHRLRVRRGRVRWYHRRGFRMPERRLAGRFAAIARLPAGRPLGLVRVVGNACPPAPCVLALHDHDDALGRLRRDLGRRLCVSCALCGVLRFLGRVLRFFWSCLASFLSCPAPGAAAGESRGAASAAFSCGTAKYFVMNVQ